MQKKIEHIIDCFDVPFLHSIALALTFSNVENLLKIVSLLAAIGYTGWKWQYEYKNRKKK